MSRERRVNKMIEDDIAFMNDYEDFEDFEDDDDWLIALAVTNNLKGVFGTKNEIVLKGSIDNEKKGK